MSVMLDRCQKIRDNIRRYIGISKRGRKIYSEQIQQEKKKIPSDHKIKDPGKPDKQNNES